MLQTAALWLAGTVEVRLCVGVKRETKGKEMLLKRTPEAVRETVNNRKSF